MSCLFGTLFFLILLFLILKINNKSKQKKYIGDLLSRWGKPKEDYFNFNLISRYADLQQPLTADTLSSQTLSDIDFQELFIFIDRTISKPGQQYLYSRLINPETETDKLYKLKMESDFFINDSKVRTQVQLELSRLNRDDAYYLADLLKRPVLQRPKWIPLLLLDSLITLLMLFLLPFFPVLFIWLLIPFSINIVFHFWNKKNTFPFLQSLPQLSLLVRVSERLCNMDIPLEKDKVRRSLNNLRSFQRKMRFISFERNGILDEIQQGIQYFWEMIKALLLIEVHALFAVLRDMEHKQPDIESLFLFVGEMDVAISTASVKLSGHLICTPQFTAPGKEIKATKIYHPLVPQCVGNDIAAKGKSVLITGSNISGKSTFLRTFAVNILLAQTLYFCFAESYSAPFLTLHSAIRITDDLMKGESYYLKEVAIMASLIKAASETRQNFFILDEVYRGTNTTERIAASKAVLSFLNKNENLVFVATHDLALSDLLENEFDLYHFEESINDGRLYFDHKLKPGPLTTRNALKILEMAHYPESIINEARTIAGRI